MIADYPLRGTRQQIDLITQGFTGPAAAADDLPAFLQALTMTVDGSRLVAREASQQVLQSVVTTVDRDARRPL